MMKFVADIETANGTEPYNTEPLEYSQLIKELDSMFNFTEIRINKGWNHILITDTATIHIYGVEDK